MVYTDAHLLEFETLLERHRREGRDLQVAILNAARRYQDTNPGLFEHLSHGASRRLGVALHAMERIFELFPPSRKDKLPPEIRQDVEINLHALHMHVVAITDNLAWSYVLRHGITRLIESPRRVGLFTKSTWKRLPEPLHDYVRSDRVFSWYTDNAKVFRDALAHKVPPYIPPSALTNEQAKRAKELLAGLDAAASRNEMGQWRELFDEFTQLGDACFMYAHSVVGPTSDRRFLHFQVQSDVALVIELCSLFLKHWNDPPRLTKANPMDRIRVDVQLTRVPGGVAAHATAIDISTNTLLSRATVSSNWDELVDAATLGVPEVSDQALTDHARATALALAKRKLEDDD